MTGFWTAAAWVGLEEAVPLLPPHVALWPLSFSLTPSVI